MGTVTDVQDKQEALDRAHPNDLADLLRGFNFGSFLRAFTREVTETVSTASGDAGTLMPELDPNSMFIWLPSLVVWSLFWKGYALWRSARNSQKGWFVFLLVVNTLGILEILYLSLFQKHQSK